MYLFCIVVVDTMPSSTTLIKSKMKTTVNGLAMIILPPNISVGEAEILFSEVLKKLRLESTKISA